MRSTSRTAEGDQITRRVTRSGVGLFRLFPISPANHAFFRAEYLCQSRSRLRLGRRDGRLRRDRRSTLFRCRAWSPSCRGVWHNLGRIASLTVQVRGVFRTRGEYRDKRRFLGLTRNLSEMFPEWECVRKRKSTPRVVSLIRVKLTPYRCPVRPR